MEKIEIVGDDQSYKLSTPIRVWSLVLEIDQGNAGAYFEVFGQPCEERIPKPKDDFEQMKEQFGILPTAQTVYLDCYETIDQYHADNIILQCSDECKNIKITPLNVRKFIGVAIYNKKSLVLVCLPLINKMKN